MSRARDHWTSRLGFVLAATGSAIGLGNLWKFPYITWDNNGGAFVLVYLLCIVLIGLPIMMTEILIGRKTQKSPVGAMKAAVGPAWGWVGGFPQTSLFRAWGPRLAPGLFMVGDSIFPGQSTAAVALGGLRVAGSLLADAGLELREPVLSESNTLAANTGDRSQSAWDKV